MHERTWTRWLISNADVLLVAVFVGLIGVMMVFSLRGAQLPHGWKADQINNGLPYRWEKGTVCLLVWEVIEDDRPFKYTQILVLKRFDEPTKEGKYRWVLAHLYHQPDDVEWPWRGPKRIPAPFPRDEQAPKMTSAHLYGYEFYKDLPTDDQIKTFLQETSWAPRLETHEAITMGTITTKLTDGGINRTLWKTLFNCDVPTDLFPELVDFNKK